MNTETLDQKVARLIKMLDKHGQQQRSAGWDERGDGDSPDDYDVAAVAVRKDFEAALRTELAPSQKTVA